MNKIILLLSTVILVFLVSCVDERLDKPDERLEEIVVKPIDDQNNNEVGFAGITKQQCQEANGFWNECGSPCTGTDAEICIQVCQVQCECSGKAGFGCPEGFKCRLTGNIVDEIGVCIGK